MQFGLFLYSTGKAKFFLVETMQIVSDDSDLINGFRNGEEAAIRKMYNLHYRSLCYFAEKLINDKTEAEDIAVETFLKLLNKRSDFDKLPEIKAFLFTATRNACIDFLRKTKRRDKSIWELGNLSEPDEVFGEKEMVTAKVLQVIYAEVEKLPGQCRQVFKSVFIEGKSTAAVASEMGISTQTVLNQKAKALQTLRLSFKAWRWTGI
jgi:RNA polymerase sigma-70 factor (ECF subfamily)